MNYKNFYYALFIFALMIYSFDNKSKPTEITESGLMAKSEKITNIPICVDMYNTIKKYATEYDIPLKYAFGIAYQETHYNGPFHWKYNHKQTSCVGAIGPMQIMPSTARLVWKDSTFTNQQLMNSIDFNVHTSMKLLRILHDKYQDWKIVFGCYNTGKPLINQYALNVFNFKPKWKLNI